jgi:glucose uptake protein GlcU
MPRRWLLGATMLTTSALFLCSVIQLGFHASAVVVLGSNLSMYSRDAALISHDALLFVNAVVCLLISAVTFAMALHSAGTTPYKVANMLDCLFDGTPADTA